MSSSILLANKLLWTVLPLLDDIMNYQCATSLVLLLDTNIFIKVGYGKPAVAQHAAVILGVFQIVVGHLSYSVVRIKADKANLLAI